MSSVQTLYYVFKAFNTTQLFAFHFIFLGHGIIDSLYMGIIKVHFLIQSEFISLKQEAACSKAFYVLYSVNYA